MSVRLFPATMGPEARRDKIVWGFCRKLRYGFDEETQTWDEAAYQDAPAMRAFFAEKLLDQCRRVYHVERRNAHDAEYTEGDF